MSGREFDDAGPLLAVQEAVVPPPLPAHVQFHGPVPKTGVGIPTEQSMFVGIVGMVLPLAAPHTPLARGGVPVICVGVLAASVLLDLLLSVRAESTSAMAPK